MLTCALNMFATTLKMKNLILFVFFSIAKEDLKMMIFLSKIILVKCKVNRGYLRYCI